jgi:hypothetical protein
VIGPRYREEICLDDAAMIEDRLGIITPMDPRWPGATYCSAVPQARDQSLSPICGALLCPPVLRRRGRQSGHSGAEYTLYDPHL